MLAAARESAKVIATDVVAAKLAAPPLFQRRTFGVVLSWGMPARTTRGITDRAAAAGQPC